MYVTTVIPISRGISKETLTYLSTSRLQEGSLIDIPLRKKTVKAIILNVEDAKKKKLSLKSSTYILKKIDSLKERKFLSFWMIEIVRTLSDHFASSQGAMLYASLSKNIFDNEIASFPQKINMVPRKVTGFEGSFDFRIDKYKEIIKKNLGNKKSTVILFPTLDSLKRVNEELKKDYKDLLLNFHSKITKKKFLNNMEIIKSENLKIILTTGSFLFLIPENTQTLIIEEENSRWYKMRNRPFVNFINVADEISKKLYLELIYGDILLRSETCLDVPNFTKENRQKLRTNIIHSKLKSEELQTNNKQAEYDPLGKEIKEEISKTLKDKGNVFIWVPRKGYSPVVLCQHCGATVKCHSCDAPVVLHVNKKIPPPQGFGEAKYFLCHHCGEKRSAIEKCEICQSWKLGAFGIGVERVEEEVRKDFKSNFVQIEIGTEKIIYDLRSRYDLVVIPSIDSLLSLPDFNIDERLFRTVLLLKERTKKKIIIKTKYKDLGLLKHIENEDLNKFHKEKLELRKKFGYSPFQTLIKITLRGNKGAIAKQLEIIRDDIKKWNPVNFPAFIRTIKNQFIMHILIKIDKEKWPDTELLEYLRSLPPSIEINVDPESLL